MKIMAKMKGADINRINELREEIRSIENVMHTDYSRPWGLYLVEIKKREAEIKAISGGGND
jgi:hypothetical protein